MLLNKPLHLLVTACFKSYTHLSVPGNPTDVFNRMDLVPWTHGCGHIVQVPDEDLRLPSPGDKEVGLEGVNI